MRFHRVLRPPPFETSAPMAASADRSRVAVAGGTSLAMYFFAVIPPAKPRRFPEHSLHRLGLPLVHGVAMAVEESALFQDEPDFCRAISCARIMAPVK